jgi:putative two-component system protein, hydrogenase maturation factor HypX/HoxX
VLPRRVGAHRAQSLTGRCEPADAGEAVRIGLVDEVLTGPPVAFEEAVLQYATRLAASPEYSRLLQRKRETRAADERHRPLESYRSEELALMHRDILRPTGLHRGPPRVRHQAGQISQP